MIDRTTKLRLRRTVRQGKRQVEDLGLQAEERLEKHLIKRFGRLMQVRSFVASWLALVIFLFVGVIVQIRSLSNHYTTLQPVPGGLYTEGLVGSFTDANPLYATGLADTSVARLLFASLFKIDSNGALEGDLANSWEVDERGVQYTVKLRDNLRWHDNQPLTSDDVVFTYQIIQNPDAKSSLFSSWQGIKVTAPDAKTVVFTLPNALSSFPFSMTNGIVPKHRLANVPVVQLRSIRFNTAEPVGAGPFKLDRLEVTGDSPETRQEKVGLIPFGDYHGGKPKLEKLVIRSFHDEKAMVTSFQNGELNAMAGLGSRPEVLQDNDSLVENSVPLAGEVVVFFKTTSPLLSDLKVRRALVQSVKMSNVISVLGYPVVSANSPLLRSHLGYDKAYTQLSFDLNAANLYLDEAGWKKAEDGIRTKDGQKLTFELFAQNTPEYTQVTRQLQEQWQSLGVDAQVQLLPSDELQGTVARHDYDALLYGISLGSDPDVFAYWHSSQANPTSVNRLNFSEYKSTSGDKALEAGRSRTDQSSRAIKYRPFLDSWRNDAPALVLYQPRFLYITRGPLSGFDAKVINEAADRFNNVNAWMFRQEKVPNS